jgi:Uma2 family endonuclease
MIMTVADFPARVEPPEGNEPQRFIFHDVDWDFYQSVGEKLAERRVFVTYCKGKLEIVTVSLLHERITALLVIMIRIMAEETSLPLGSAGMTTLKRIDLDEGVEPDSSFYTKHERQMRGKSELDLPIDPPPDLAIEVEVTRRLGTRKSIYREIGVPEIWICSLNGLSVQIKGADGYVDVDRSPTFPTLALEEMMQILKAGLNEDETAFAKAFRKRVQQAMASKP